MNTEVIIRKVKTLEKKIFLTFDDGPTEFTKKVLSLLSKHQAKATFFVVGKKVENHPGIFQQILDNQHTVYSHSIDHAYKNLFSHDQRMQEWMSNSIQDLFKKTNYPSTIFRPPAGIITPPMKRAAQKAGIKLVLWNIRFFDSIHKITESKVNRYLDLSSDGDIILLHDAQRSQNQSSFLKILEYLIISLQQKGYSLCALQEKDLSLDQINS